MVLNNGSGSATRNNHHMWSPPSCGNRTTGDDPIPALTKSAAPTEWYHTQPAMPHKKRIPKRRIPHRAGATTEAAVLPFVFTVIFALVFPSPQIKAKIKVRTDRDTPPPSSVLRLSVPDASPTPGHLNAPLNATLTRIHLTELPRRSSGCKHLLACFLLQLIAGSSTEAPAEPASAPVSSICRSTRRCEV